MQSGPCPPVRLGRVSALIGLSALIACSAVADPAHQPSPEPHKQLSLMAGVQLNKLRYDETGQHIDVGIQMPFFKNASYHRQAFVSKNRQQNWRGYGTGESLRWRLPHGLSFEMGRSDVPSGAAGRRNLKNEFVGLTFSTLNLQDAQSGARRNTNRSTLPGPQDPRPQEKPGTGFWRVAGTVALVAVLAGGGGGGSSDSGGTSLQFSRDSGRAGGTDGSWQLVWQDEFAGTALDSSNWTKRDSYGREDSIDACFDGGNYEAQCYTDRPENISVAGGHLVLTARHETFTATNANNEPATRNFTSGRIQSSGKRDFKYGRFEARIQFPIADGSFPAFWMLPTDNVYGFWPRSGEIDIVENANGDNKISGAIHYKNPADPRSTKHIYQSAPTSPVAVNDWNTYAVEWHPDEIRWYLNGQSYFSRQRQSWNDGHYPVDPTSDHAPFDQDFHLILNLALKDNPLGTTTPINAAQYDGAGQAMRVDYVRVYECSAGPNFCQGQ